MGALAVSKFLPLALLPIGLVLICLWISFLSKSRKWVAVTAGILGLFSTPVVADRLMQTLEDRYQYRSDARLPHADAVFVFGGMLGLRGHPGTEVEWNDCADRFEKAVSLYRAGKAKTIVLSGGAPTYEGGPDEGQILQRKAIERCVPEADILVTAATLNTEMEVQELCNIVAERHWRTVILVTSAYHMPRVMRLSSQALATLIPAPVAYVTPDPEQTWAFGRIEYYMPQAKALLVSETALREYIGVAVYSILHG